MREKSSFVWSDNWHIENGKAWFIDALRGYLCCVNLTTRETEHVIEIPNAGSDRFRLNPKCVKVENEIFCLPDRGNNIWIYQLETSEFLQIEIENSNKVRLGIIDFWQIGCNMFMVSRGLKKIIELDIRKKKVIGYYVLSDMEDEKIERSTIVEEMIYSVSAVSNRVYQFDIKSKKTNIFSVDGVEGGLYTICFDGNNFWLSGYNKAIYVWMKDNNSVRIIKEFPPQFGIYDCTRDEKNILDCEAERYNTPVFIDSQKVGQYIWFIPFQTNLIIYVDKDTKELYVMEMEDENETKDSFKRGMNQKYIVEYVCNSKYIGLYSFKCGGMYEIDAEKRKTEKILYLQEDSYMEKTAFGRTLYELDNFDCNIFRRFLMKEKENVGINEENIREFRRKMNRGEKIYYQLTNE